MAFTLPPLPYDYSALEPHIDTQTMQIHHDKHHAAYVNNVNAALEGKGLPEQSIEDLCRNIESIPAYIRPAVRNNGGGHANHSLFWLIMNGKGGGKPAGVAAQVPAVGAERVGRQPPLHGQVVEVALHRRPRHRPHRRGRHLGVSQRGVGLACPGVDHVGGHR